MSRRSRQTALKMREVQEGSMASPDCRRPLRVRPGPRGGRRPLPLIPFYCLLLLLVLLSSTQCIHAARVRKASRDSLDRVKRLLNDEVQRQQSSVQSDAVFDLFAGMRRDPRSRFHHDELAVNNIEDYFQGDVDLSDRQVALIAEEIVAQSSGNHQRQKRKVGRAPLYKRWRADQPISFDFAPEVPAETRARIRDAMRLWQRNTCIRFEENGPSVDRLEFFDGGGCSSFVGRVGGTQGISIATPGCDVVGIISHEIGHSLGVFHEQARPDQERNIAVNYNNIPLSRWNNFQAVDEEHADVLGLPYDSGSVMHYGPFGFASDPFIPSIRTLDRSLQNTIGQRAGPAFLDYEAINLAYNCSSRCASAPPLACHRGGYRSPNNCSTCACPDGLAGTLCANIRISNAACGGVLRATTVHHFLSSPNYPSDYPRNAECYWMLQAPTSGRVFLEFVDDMGFLCEDSCDKSYVEIKYHNDFRLTGARFCCPSRPRQQFVSFSNEMLVIMRGYGGAGQGFRARFWSDKGEDIPPPPSLPPPSSTAKPTVPTTTLMTTSAELSTLAPMLTTPRLAATSTPRVPLPSLFSLPPMLTMPPPTPSSTREPITTPPSIAVTVKATSFEKVDPNVPEGQIPVNDCGCEMWSSWAGECSQQCGGCGSRTRKRICPKESCQTVEKRPCNFRACPTGTNFLLNNGEIHLLWRGCCVGLFRSGEECTALESGSNSFLKLISQLLSAQDASASAARSETVRAGESLDLRRRLN